MTLCKAQNITFHKNETKTCFALSFYFESMEKWAYGLSKQYKARKQAKKKCFSSRGHFSVKNME